MEVGKMPTQRKNQSRRLTAAGLIAVTAATLLMMAWAVFPTPAGAVLPGVDGNCDQSGTTINPGGSATVGGVTVSLSNTTITISGGSANVCVKAGDCNSGIITLGPGTHDLSGIIQWQSGNDCDEAGPPFPGVSHIVVYQTQTTTTETTPTETTTTETTPTETTTTETTPTETTTTSTTTTTSSTTTTTTTPGGGGGGGGGTTTTTVPTTTTTASPTVGPTTIHKSTTTTDEVLPTTVTPGGTAFTGVENVVPIGAIALMLMTSGSGLLWAGSRRRRDDGSEDED
jgi:hypothetical protein